MSIGTSKLDPAKPAAPTTSAEKIATAKSPDGFELPEFAALLKGETTGLEGLTSGAKLPDITKGLFSEEFQQTTLQISAEITQLTTGLEKEGEITSQEANAVTSVVTKVTISMSQTSITIAAKGAIPVDMIPHQLREMQAQKAGHKGHHKLRTTIEELEENGTITEEEASQVEDLISKIESSNKSGAANPRLQSMLHKLYVLLEKAREENEKDSGLDLSGPGRKTSSAALPNIDLVKRALLTNSSAGLSGNPEDTANQVADSLLNSSADSEAPVETPIETPTVSTDLDLTPNA